MYIENIFVCMAAPLAVALLFLPAYTAAQASYFDTALETNPIPQPPQTRD